MSKSHDILGALGSKRLFDKAILNLDLGDLRLKHETEGEYRSLASRLRGLYSEIENPAPRGYLEERFERRIRSGT